MLDRLNLGEKGPPLKSALAFSNESNCAPSYYPSTGEHYIYATAQAVGPGLVAYKIVVGSTGGIGDLQEAWKATDANGNLVFTKAQPGSPMVNNFVPSAGPSVWTVMGV